MSVRIICGDVRDVLKTLPDQSVHCVITSPPYWNLRDYGVEGQIGLESTLAEYIETMVDVFREVWRVLRDDGTLWLNLGDSYCNDSGPLGIKNSPMQRKNVGSHHRAHKLTIGNGIKRKDLIGLPWRVAFALQTDGWYLRRDHIWHKTNPMPESVTDRATSSHEYIFLLTKRARYFYDHVAVKTAVTGNTHSRGTKMATPKTAASGEGIKNNHSFQQATWGSDITERNMRSVWEEDEPPPMKVPSGWDTDPSAHRSIHRNGRTDKQRGHSRRHDGFNDRWDGMSKEEQQAGGANMRSVWTFGTEAFPEAHFATFPTALVVPCVRAGTSEKGACAACGAPWVRVVDRENASLVASERVRNVGGRTDGYTRLPAGGVVGGSSETTGWDPSCRCDAGEPVPCVVLDPFSGAGTTGLVADRLQRDAILIELNSDYLEIARKRIERAQGPLFAAVEVIP